MRNLQWHVFAAIVLGSTLARANSINSSISVDNAVGCETVYSCIGVSGSTFHFPMPANGASVAHFTNLSGIAWHSLILTETGVPAIEVKCTSNLFGCTVVPYGANGARIILRASGRGGIRIGKSFEIGCPSCTGVSFSGAVEIAPEPETYILLLTGILALIAMPHRSSFTLIPYFLGARPSKLN